MCDSGQSSGCDSLPEGREAVWRMKLQALKRNEVDPAAPLEGEVDLHLSASRCRKFVQCISLCF